MFPYPVSAQQGETIPPKIATALQYMEFAQRIREGHQSPFGGDVPKDTGRKLSDMEDTVYDSALTVLLEYFNEPGWGNTEKISDLPPPDGPEEKKPEIVPT